MFSCVAVLIFSRLDAFSSFPTILVTYFETSLGSWNLKIYKLYNDPSDPDKYDLDLYNNGVIYHCFVLLVNMVLFLNFVIAILSATFAYYENKQLGLYYEVIVGLFPSMEYDDRYGAVVCA